MKLTIELPEERVKSIIKSAETGAELDSVYMAVVDSAEAKSIGDSTEWVEDDDSGLCYCKHCRVTWDMVDNDVHSFLYCPHCGKRISQVIDGAIIKRGHRVEVFG